VSVSAVSRAFSLGLIIVLVPISACAADIPRAAFQYRDDLIRAARFVWGLEAPTATMAAQVHQESAWRERAQSSYAAGLAQFTPATAEWISGVYRGELADPDPFNPGWALRALVRYDRHLWERAGYAATDCDRWAFALAGYNGGAGWINRERRVTAAMNLDAARWWEHVETQCVRADWACRENREYPRRILYRHQPLYVAAGWGPGVCT
jgi:soluble lytic murein transglycosylase-like protein